MNKLKRILSSWQGWLAFVVALAAFLVSPTLIRAVDPTAGVFDGGIVQFLVLGVVAAALGVGVIWALWQIAFPTTDKAADEGLARWFSEMSSTSKWWAVQGTFLAMLAYWVAILAVLPK